VAPAEGDEGVSLDPVPELMEDGPDGEVASQGFERLLYGDGVDVSAPQMAG
jgi:hypothetical protein